ncbi:conserved Plasmodium protein, unknown function [Plasmodium malariae]|uniref:Uncharacterized protein n=1 Tax=Plasmodium malariae TaxID=5858 RepID=A0A1C3KZA6_PLAMA|nr:conserved Plasmodium protein, unknown function [Plasmodium malariae]
MNKQPNKRYIHVYYVKKNDKYRRHGKRCEREKGYVTIEITRIDERKCPYRKRKNQELLQNDQTNEFLQSSIKNFSKKKKIKKTWTKILYDILHHTTNSINQKINSFLKFFVLHSEYFSRALNISRETLVQDSFKYFNSENARRMINCTSSSMYEQKFHQTQITSATPERRDSFHKFQILSKNIIPCNHLMGIFDKTEGSDKCYAKDIMTNLCDIKNKIQDKNIDQTNESFFINDKASSNETISMLDTSNEQNNLEKQNVKNFYISTVNRKTNAKNIRKISLIEISVDPQFFIFQDFLTDLESYLALNHCLLYVKKNKKELTEIHQNFFSILINVDEVKFLENKLSKSVLRHIVRRLNSLFKIPTNDICGVEFCLYLKNNDMCEAPNFSEKNMYTYSIIIFLNNKNTNFVEFPYCGLKIMTKTGNCLIYEHKKNVSNNNIFKFGMSEEKLFFLKINLKDHINLHMLIGRKHAKLKHDQLFEKNKMTYISPNKNNSKNNTLYSYNQYFNEFFPIPVPNNTNLMRNSYLCVKKNMDIINKQIIQLNTNSMRDLFLRAKQKGNYPPFFASSQC